MLIQILSVCVCVCIVFHNLCSFITHLWKKKMLSIEILSEHDKQLKRTSWSVNSMALMWHKYKVPYWVYLRISSHAKIMNESWKKLWWWKMYFLWKHWHDPIIPLSIKLNWTKFSNSLKKIYLFDEFTTTLSALI